MLPVSYPYMVTIQILIQQYISLKMYINILITYPIIEGREGERGGREKDGERETERAFLLQKCCCDGLQSSQVYYFQYASYHYEWHIWRTAYI